MRESEVQIGNSGQNGRLAAVGKFVVATHISGCRSRTRFPMDMCKV